MQNNNHSTCGRARLLERLRKVMAMAESPNAHEAAAALEKAAALMAEYGLTQEDVAMSDVQEHPSTLRRANPTDYDTMLMYTIAEAFNCDLFIQTGRYEKSQVVYVGINPAPEVAGYAFAVLNRKLFVARRDYLATISRKFKPVNRTRKANAWALGWALGVRKAAKALMASYKVPGIVVSYMATLAAKQEFTKTKPRETADTTNDKTRRDINAGYAAGQRESLNVPVNGSTAAAPKLLH